jgi:hypothetical protein
MHAFRDNVHVQLQLHVKGQLNINWVCTATCAFQHQSHIIHLMLTQKMRSRWMSNKKRKQATLDTNAHILCSSRNQLQQHSNTCQSGEQQCHTDKAKRQVAAPSRTHRLHHTGRLQLLHSRIRRSPRSCHRAPVLQARELPGHIQTPSHQLEEAIARADQGGRRQILRERPCSDKQS